MHPGFESDPYRGGLKILFVGRGDSSHTQAWIDLFNHEELNIRLFSLPGGAPPDDWNVRTYIASARHLGADTQYRKHLFSSNRIGRALQHAYAQSVVRRSQGLIEQSLARVIRTWRPDIVHTVAVRAGGEFYHRVREQNDISGIGRWVMQIYGGSDLTLDQLDPVRAKELSVMLSACDYVLADNIVDLRDAVALGLDSNKIADINPIPGVGGLDIDGFVARWSGPPSGRRSIVMPKTYEFFQSKALPVFEALRIAWDRIQPCSIHMLAAQPETLQWFRYLPAEIRANATIEERVPRTRALELMARARVMLAPSLLDGTPNSLLEAMASGALPIVSPIEPIQSLVAQQKNVLFARNLYPEEIAEALVRAMNDDAFVDEVAARNLVLVRSFADRDTNRSKIVRFYRSIASSSAT